VQKRNFLLLGRVPAVVRRALLLCLLLLLALPAAAQAARGSCVAGKSGPSCTVWTAKVVSVNDGDTLDADVAFDGTTRARRIRLAGVQAMEQTAYSSRSRAGDCHAVDATHRLEGLVRRSRGIVRLAAKDPQSTSRGRLVRTVAVKVGRRWVDAGTRMIREGRALWWASWSESAPNRQYSVLLQRAIAAQRGLFDPDACGVGPSAASPLKLWVNWDADGDDTANPAGEWVRVRNLDPVNPVALGGWYLRDSGLRRYNFPADAAIPPGGRITLDVGSAGSGGGVFGWGLRDPVFENATDDEDAMGDGAYLFDPLGNVRASMVYPCRDACSDPAQGAVSVTADPEGRRESITLSNLTAGPLDLDGYVVKSPPYSYALEQGTVLPAGGSLRIEVGGDPADDTALERHWGFARPILRDAGDVARLATYTDITLACTAWGDEGC
jgi:endonuclease YncB( thermonuclease family)